MSFKPQLIKHKGGSEFYAIKWLWWLAIPVVYKWPYDFLLEDVVETIEWGHN